MILNLNLEYKGKITKTLSINTDNLKIEEEIYDPKYNKKIYKVEVTEDMKEICWEFSERIISGGNQFDRLHPSWTSNKEEQKLIRIQRTYAGKIGELCFLILLAYKNKKVDYSDMFKIYVGPSNTDSYDFKTTNEKTIDIKTAFRSFHTNLVVNSKQLEKIPKDFYVGVKLNAKDAKSNEKIIDDSSINEAIIYGYADLKYLMRLATENLGEGDCTKVNLGRLMNIDKLTDNF